MVGLKQENKSVKISNTQIQSNITEANKIIQEVENAIQNLKGANSNIEMQSPFNTIKALIGTRADYNFSKSLQVKKNFEAFNRIFSDFNSNINISKKDSIVKKLEAAVASVKNNIATSE